VNAALVMRAKNGDRSAADAICRELLDLISATARGFYFPGADHDDVVQWGMWGVLQGIRFFDPSRNDSPRGFLIMCARRWMVTGLKHHRKVGAAPLNESWRLEQPIADESGDSRLLIEEVVDRSADDPADAVIAADEFRALVAFVGSGLTEREARIYRRSLNGATLREQAIAETGIDPGDGRCKRVENALDRSYRKIRGFQQGREAA
jgi:RNA polymerase sporulation-specific sigma factor